MRTAAICIFGLGALALTAGCTGAETEPEPELPVSPAAVLVARSGGGTIELPLRDQGVMRQLQGIGVEPPPTLALLSPAPGAVLEQGPLTVQYEIANYEVGQESGRHVHVILDDQAYRADYSPDGSVTFASEELGPGPHVLTAFLSQPMHLSLKNDGAAARVSFQIGADGASGDSDLGAPTLVYSRPKGSYNLADGSADNIMLDFYLFNVELSPDGYRVRATIDGGPAMLIDSWGPRVILTDPAPGEHTVRLELLDAAGEPVPGPANDTTRTITVTE